MKIICRQLVSEKKEKNHPCTIQIALLSKEQAINTNIVNLKEKYGLMQHYLTEQPRDSGPTNYFQHMMKTMD